MVNQTSELLSILGRLPFRKDETKKKRTLWKKEKNCICFIYHTGLHPISPKFKRNSPQYLTLNKPGWIHCQVISDPRAKLFWTKTLPWPNGEHLPDLEFLPFSNGSLFVRKAKKSYEGDFYCTAVNSGGIKLQDITVKVAGKKNNRLTLEPLGVTRTLFLPTVSPLSHTLRS